MSSVFSCPNCGHSSAQTRGVDPRLRDAAQELLVVVKATKEALIRQNRWEYSALRARIEVAISKAEGGVK